MNSTWHMLTVSHRSLSKSGRLRQRVSFSIALLKQRTLRRRHRPATRPLPPAKNRRFFSSQTDHRDTQYVQACLSEHCRRPSIDLTLGGLWSLQRSHFDYSHNVFQRSQSISIIHFNHIHPSRVLSFASTIASCLPEYMYSWRLMPAKCVPSRRLRLSAFQSLGANQRRRRVTIQDLASDPIFHSLLSQHNRS